MSHDKAIKYGKEHRKPHKGSARFDESCRNNGGCTWCEGRRTFFDRKRRQEAILKIKEYYEEEECTSIEIKP